MRIDSQSPPPVESRSKRGVWQKTSKAEQRKHPLARSLGEGTLLTFLDAIVIRPSPHNPVKINTIWKKAQTITLLPNSIRSRWTNAPAMPCSEISFIDRYFEISRLLSKAPRRGNDAST
jgi:hypothetical protein